VAATCLARPAGQCSRSVCGADSDTESTCGDRQPDAEESSPARSVRNGLHQVVKAAPVHTASSSTGSALKGRSSLPAQCNSTLMTCHYATSKRQLCTDCFATIKRSTDGFASGRLPVSRRAWRLRLEAVDDTWRQVVEGSE